MANNSPYFAGIDTLNAPVNTQSRLFDAQPLTDWFNSFKEKPLTPMQQKAAGIIPAQGSGSMPMFSDMASIVTPQEVGAGTVLSMPQVPNMGMFAGAGSVPQGAGVGSVSDGSVSPVFPSLAQPTSPITATPTAAVSPVQAMPVEAAPTQMFSSMYGGNPAEAYGTEALASQTAPIEGGSSMMDFFGLGDMTGKDWMGAGFGAAQLGLGAYGMFKGLDQMDTRLDQGQQALNLSREEYDENLRHRNAIVSQNKGA